jgi:hypothetical protein
MSRIREIERQIADLSESEFAELREWFLHRDWKALDVQIEQDAEAGKLDDIIKQARDDHNAGKSREL